MFKQVNQEFMNVANDLGFFKTGYKYAADTTWVDWHGSNQGPIINNPEECNTDSGWLFAAVSIMATDARFAVGTDIVNNKSDVIDHYQQYLVDIVQRNDINGIYMDREFASADGVEMCQFISEKWVIRAKNLNNGDINDKYNQTAKGESYGPEPIDFAGVTPRPQLYIHPLNDEEIDTDDTHMLFLVSRKFDETDGAYIYDSYHSRWNIETYFRQLKNDFTPKSKSPSPEERLFLYNIGLIFYNIHTLINRAPSPKYGLRLNVPHDMVLQAIVDHAFSREDPFIL
jgi:hypothetical protein